MKGAIGYVLALLVALVVLLPVAGPWLGLAGFRDAVHAPGRAIAAGDSDLNVCQTGQRVDVVLVHRQPGSSDMLRLIGDALVPLGLRVTRYDRKGWGYSACARQETPTIRRRTRVTGST